MAQQSENPNLDYRSSDLSHLDRDAEPHTLALKATELSHQDHQLTKPTPSHPC
jgi:hypothetical protein